MKCARLEFSGCRVRAPAAQSVGAAGVSHDSPRAQMCTFQGFGLQKHQQNSTKGPQERERRMKIVAGGGKKKSEILGGPAEGCPAEGCPAEGCPAEGCPAEGHHNTPQHTHTHNNTQQHTTHNKNTHQHHINTTPTPHRFTTAHKIDDNMDRSHGFATHTRRQQKVHVRLRPNSTSANFDFGQFRLRPISTSANSISASWPKSNCPKSNWPKSSILGEGGSWVEGGPGRSTRGRLQAVQRGTGHSLSVAHTQTLAHGCTETHTHTCTKPQKPKTQSNTSEKMCLWTRICSVRRSMEHFMFKP